MNQYVIVTEDGGVTAPKRSRIDSELDLVKLIDAGFQGEQVECLYIGDTIRRMKNEALVGAIEGVR